MQNYAKEHSIKDAPHHLLIGSYFGKKIGILTPLLKWYLNHGLIITRIYIPLSNIYLMQLSTVSGYKSHKQNWMEIVIKTKH